MSNTKNTKLIAIITMCFIFAMISFVTNMGAPFGNIWGFEYPFAKAWGNLMNFAAYLFMGIPVPCSISRASQVPAQRYSPTTAFP